VSTAAAAGYSQAKFMLFAHMPALLLQSIGSQPTLMQKLQSAKYQPAEILERATGYQNALKQS
jgi:hypothetical protein